MTETTDTVRFAIDAGIAQVRFCRPAALNTIDVAMARRLLEVATALRADKSVRVVVLSGEGRAFMAGGDLAGFRADPARAPDTARDMIEPLHAAIVLLAEGDAPVIASLRGAVAGAGMSLALGADLAIAADDVKFNMAYARIGASVDAGGTWALPRLVGLRRAMEIALCADAVDAPTALQMGLVNRVVPLADLERETVALATRLAQGPTLAYGRIKRLLRAASSHSLATQLDAERDAFVAGAGTADFAEGVAAFFDKRAPRFQGR